MGESDPNAQALDSGLPPVVTCAICGRPECPGCESIDQRTSDDPSNPWEAAGKWPGRLWAMSLASATAPTLTFGQLAGGPLRSALAFAFIAEFMAVASLGAAVAAVAFLAAPALTLRVLSDPAANALLAGALLGLIVILVVLHAIWGLCLEAGIASTGGLARWRLGMRFGLYACGWDLLTSPAGVFQGLLSLGPRGTWSTLHSAISVPRTAMTAYLVENRHFTLAARRRATLISAVMLGLLLLLLAVQAVIVVVRVAVAMAA